MRKGIVILLLVTIAIMLVMAAPAFAKTGTKSGGYWAYSTTNQNFASGTTVFASATVSPHAGYSTTTGKCKVCHAVHGAGTSTNGVMAPTEKLLRSTAANSCTYCHLGTGAFATDPYAYVGPRGSWASESNYYSNDSSPPSGVVKWTLPAGGAGVQDSSAGRSGHNATHGHDNPQGVTADLKSYKGCASCHAVHGANTMMDGALKPSILKNDPAKGTTAAVNSGWGVGGSGYGSIYAPTTTQAQFCEDCHDGTKLVGPLAAGNPATTVTPIVSQADFNTYFPSCGANDATNAACHNSVQQVLGADTAGSISQFGAFNNKLHNGRSHITTNVFSNVAGGASGVGVETVYATGNSCAVCHNTPKSIPGVKQATFPHFWPSNELIQNFDRITESDGPCMNCHGGRVGVTF